MSWVPMRSSSSTHQPIEEEQDKLIEYLEYLESQGSQIKQIWLTHQHGDHVGAVNRIRERFKIPVRSHRLTEETLPADIPVNYIEPDEYLIIKNSDGQDFAGVRFTRRAMPEDTFAFTKKTARP